MFVSQGLGGPKGNGNSSYSKGKQVNIPVQHNLHGNVYVYTFDASWYALQDYRPVQSF